MEWPRLAVGWPDGHRLGLTECEMGSDKPARAPHEECASATLGPGPRLPQSFYLELGGGVWQDVAPQGKAMATWGASAGWRGRAAPSSGRAACTDVVERQHRLQRRQRLHGGPSRGMPPPTLCWRRGLQPRRVKCAAARAMMAGRPQRGVPGRQERRRRRCRRLVPCPLAACSEGCVADSRHSYTFPVCSSSTPGEGGVGPVLPPP